MRHGSERLPHQHSNSKCEQSSTGSFVAYTGGRPAVRLRESLSDRPRSRCLIKLCWASLPQARMNEVLRSSKIPDSAMHYSARLTDAELKSAVRQLAEAGKDDLRGVVHFAILLLDGSSLLPISTRLATLARGKPP